MSVEIQSFEEEVLEKSHTIPVLVDFWAPWCGPCRILGPVLERVAEDQAGRFELVKVNTDENPELSMQYGIRGIPAVKLFVDGEVVNEFTGALPEHAVRAWLDEAIPSETRARFADAGRLFFAGDHDAARELLKRIVADEPDNSDATVLLAATNVWRDPGTSVSAVETLEIVDPTYLQVADSIRQIAASLSAQELPDGPGKDPVSSAIAALKESRFESAMESLIRALTIDRYYDDDHARKLGVSVFTLLGTQHPVTRKQRRAFDMALY